MYLTGVPSGMKKLLISPSQMALGEQEGHIYQNILKQASEISLACGQCIY